MREDAEDITTRKNISTDDADKFEWNRNVAVPSLRVVGP